MPVTLTCEKCAKKFSVAPYYARRGQRFCSLACSGVKRERSPLSITACQVCGAQFKKQRHISALTRHDFCSWACYSEYRRQIGKRGASNPYWRGGRDAERNAWSKSPEGRRWVREVLAAGGNKCWSCGAVRDLHAHHVVSFRDHPDGRSDVANGIVLCRSCHTKAHHPKGVIHERAC